MNLIFLIRIQNIILNHTIMAMRIMLGILVIDLEQVNLLVLKGMNSFLLHQMFLLLEFILRI